jgi:hypothetical protein
MPRVLAVVTYLAAIILLLSLSLSVWVVLIFPGWVLVISVYILIHNLRRRSPDVANGRTAGSTS